MHSDLGNNELEHVQADAVASNLDLVTLSLARNRLRGDLLLDLSALERLRVLNFAGNEIERVNTALCAHQSPTACMYEEEIDYDFYYYYSIFLNKYDGRHYCSFLDNNNISSVSVEAFGACNELVDL